MMLQALNPKDARVLIVEDSPNDQEIAARALKTFGIRHWRVARTAEDALREVAKHAFDVVLIDYNLPGMNGLQFMENMRRDSPDTRIIVVTGVRQESVAVAAMKLGASDYISKDQFLTSGIMRSLQSALRERVSSAESEQRALLSARSRELQEAASEGIWLVQALDERHGYRPASGSLYEPLDHNLEDAVHAFTDYIRASCDSFPEPATQSEDDLLRMLSGHGLSPRDVFRLYVASLREMMSASDLDGESTPVRPVLFLAHVLACLIEEMQTHLSLQSIEGKQLGFKEAS